MTRPGGALSPRSVLTGGIDVGRDPLPAEGLNRRHPLALSAARGLHTLIYGVMAMATIGLLYVGMTGRLLPTLWIFLPLLSLEIVAFAIAGLKCPLTAVVDRFAGPGVHMPDTYLPEALTRHTVVLFGLILPVAFMLLAARWAGMIGEGVGR